MTVRANTRGAALVRIGLTTLVVTVGLFTAVAAVGAGNMIGFLIAVPPLYLLSVWAADVAKLVQYRFQPTDSYVARPYYMLWIVACSTPAAIWFAWLALR
jgi:hypothetical protein